MPNAKVLSEKQAIVADLTERLKNSSAGVFVDYKGIDVAADTALRRELRKEGIKYEVVKNTLTRFAAEAVGFNDLVPVLEGTTSLAVSETDPVAAARIINEFAKKNNKIKIKAGFVEGRVISAEDVVALAELPPKEVLVARVLAGFNAPITGFVNVLNGNIRGLVVALDAIREQKESA